MSFNQQQSYKYTEDSVFTAIALRSRFLKHILFKICETKAVFCNIVCGSFGGSEEVYIQHIYVNPANKFSQQKNTQ